VEGDLYVVTRELIGKWGAWAVSLVLIMMFLSDAAVLLRLFAENTLLTALPFMTLETAIAWYVFNAVILCYLGIECIARTSYFLLPLGTASLFLVLVGLIPFYDLNLLGPWQGRGFSQALITGVTLSSIDYGVILLFVLGPAFQNLRTIKLAALFGLGGSSLLKALLTFAFTIVFGVKIALEKNLPFFEMVRTIYINRYIQRLDALFIVVWVIAGVISIAINFYMAGYLIARMFNLSSSRPFIVSLSLLAVGAAILPNEIMAVIMLDEKRHSTLHVAGLYGIPLLLFGATIVKGRRKKPWTNG
ncbi:MAG: GerAB/ArcD/ProY family transporter, partial [Sporomusa sp.]